MKKDFYIPAVVFYSIVPCVAITSSVYHLASCLNRDFTDFFD